MCTVCGCSPRTLENKHLIKVEQDILNQNNQQAAKNRNYLNAQGVFSLNLVSSPGAGKTSLLEHTIRELKPEIDFFVIEGDQQTERDAERIRASGAQAYQINTAKVCHLDAAMIDQAIHQLNPNNNAILFIENVGNLVCPAAFDLGENLTVAMLSVTEGDDKPLKYPDIFYAADIVIISKTDLLPYVDFDIESCKHYLKRIKQQQPVITLSVKTGEGLEDWYTLLKQRRL